MLAELHMLGEELKLDQAINDYENVLKLLDNVQAYAFCDKVLQSLGEPSRFGMSKGFPKPPST
jgi:hypothetical protein